MVKDFCISSVNFRDIFGRFRSLIFNFWAHIVRIWVKIKFCGKIKFENETSKNIVILYYHPEQKVDLSFSCPPEKLFWDGILGWYFLTIQIQVKHGLETFQRSRFTQILTPWASQRLKNLKWKTWNIFSSKNIDESRRTRWERRHLACKKENGIQTFSEEYINWNRPDWFEITYYADVWIQWLKFSDLYTCYKVKMSVLRSRLKSKSETKANAKNWKEKMRNFRILITELNIDRNKSQAWLNLGSA